MKIGRLEIYIIKCIDPENVRWFEVIPSRKAPCGCAFINFFRFGATWLSKECLSGGFNSKYFDDDKE